MNTRPQPQPLPQQNGISAALNPRIPLKRAPYAALGFSLVVLKYIGDLTIGALAIRVGPIWMPFDYLHPWHSAVFAHLGSEPLAALLLIAWAVPFICIGVIYTMRRALDAGWSPWWALTFFVPYLNYAVMLTLCLWPSSDKYAVRDTADDFPRETEWAATGQGIAAALLLGAFMVWLGVKEKNTYGVSIFLGTPFVMGAIAGFFASRRSTPSLGQLLIVCLILDTLASVTGVMLAFDGAICIAMCYPLALVLIFMGAVIGRSIASGGRAIQRTSASAMILLPLFALAEPAHMAHHVLHAVRTSIEVNATPEQIWPQLNHFRTIDPPKEWYFQLGIAFPTGTHSAGAGVGASRYCEFSTGWIAERITEWGPNEVLGFDVESQPVPMVELTPYKDLDPPHLHGYVRSKKGEFRLVALADGRTRIDGTSWYEIDMQPEAYWSMWTDASVHAIHRRVLEHIKKEVEEGNSAQPR
jgi:uncharacterized membrane protein YhaH (DUF805 family)